MEKKGNKRQTTTIQIDKELMAKIKMEALKNDKFISQYVEEIVKEYLNNDGKHHRAKK